MNLSINSDPSYNPLYLEKYETEYDFDFNNGYKIKPTTSNKAIKALLGSKIYNNKLLLDDNNKLASYLVEEFKKTDSFNLMSEKKKQGVIRYLSTYPKIDVKLYKNHANHSYSDINGNSIDI